MIYSDFILTTPQGSDVYLNKAHDKTFDVQADFKASTVKFSMPTAEAKAQGVAEGKYLKVTVDEKVLPTPYIIESASWDYGTVDDVSVTEFSGRSIHAIGEDDVVFPSAWPNPTPSGHSFQNATPGTMIKTIVQRSQDRSKLLDWDHSSFTGVVDSNGQQWPSTADRSFNNGDSVLSVLQSLVDDGLVELAFDGFKLKAYVPSTLGRTVPIETVFLRPGYSISEGSVDSDFSDFATDVYAIGEGDATAYVTRPELYSVLNGRRKTKFVQYGGITNKDLLKVLAQADLDRYGVKKLEDSLKIPHEIYQPFTDYNLYDWLTLSRGDDTNTLVQVKQISIQASGDNYSVGVSLGSLIDSLGERIQRRLDAITGANAGGGAVPSDKTAIKVAPSAPTNLSTEVQPYLDNQLRRKVIAMADWSDVLTYSNGLPLANVDHYEVATKTGNAADFGASLSVDTSSAVFSGYDPDTLFQFRVRAFTDGLASPWATSKAVSLIDNTPLVLAKPSVPVLTSRWQTVAVRWDGKNSDDSWPSTDTHGVEVHVYPASGFTPSTSTYAGLIQITPGNRLGGLYTVSGLEPKTTYYIKFVPIGKQGTPGPASGESSITTSDLAVTPEQINAINTDLNKAKGDLYNPGGAVDNLKTTLTGQIAAAQSTANAAQTSANGKNTVFWSTSAPSDTENPGRNWGDVWYKYAIVNNKTQILAQWYWYNTWISAALSETFIPQLNIGTGTFGELDGMRLKAKSVQADSVLVEGSAGTTVLADGAITTSKIAALAVTADQIAANSITSAKIAANTITANEINAKSIAAATGEFVRIKADQIDAGYLNASIGIGTSGLIVAGDKSKSYATMGASGFATYGVTSDGIAYQATTLGGQGADRLSINGPDGEAAAITNEGVISGTTGIFSGDLTVQGKSLLGQRNEDADVNAEGWLDVLPSGSVLSGDIRNFITNGQAFNTGYTPIAVVGFTLDYRRQYRLTLPYRHAVTNISGSNGRCGVGMTYTYSATAATPPEPTTSDTKLVESLSAFTVAVGEVTNNISAIWTPADYGTADRKVDVKILIYAWSTACQFVPYKGTSFDWRVAVEDLGLVVDDSARSVLTAASTTPAKKTYTSTWTASDSWTFYQSGARDSYGRSSDISRAGYWDSFTGDMKTMCVFNNNATRGETTKTMASALSGAAIKKAEVFVQSAHWYNPNGGTLVIRQGSGSSIPTTLSDSTAKSGGAITKKFTSRQQGFWVTVPTSWFSTTNRSVYFGPANSTSRATYTHLYNHAVDTTSYRPQVRLTYIR